MNNIEPTNLAKIEGLLFISGDEGITLGDLAKITGFMKPAVLGLLQQLKTRYENDPVNTCRYGVPYRLLPGSVEDRSRLSKG